MSANNILAPIVTALSKSGKTGSSKTRPKQRSVKNWIDSIFWMMLKYLRMNAISLGIIETEDRFSPHDLKRIGVTDTKGTQADK